MLDFTRQVFFLHQKQDVCNICCMPCINNFCMGKVLVGVIYDTTRHKWGDLIPHNLQTIYFSNINDNNLSDRKNPVAL